MSFGFSVGDFIAVGKIITEIVNSLKDTGAKSEYQQLLRELGCLHKALVDLDKLQPKDSRASKDVEAIKYAALHCRFPLEEFLAKIKKYDKNLGIWSKCNALKGSASKTKWLLMKKEISELRAYLTIHIGTINVRLNTHLLGVIDLASKDAQSEHSDINNKLEGSCSVVAASHSMLTCISKMLSGEITSTLKSLTSGLAKACASIEQIYGAVLDIRCSLQSPDTRFTFFQAPLQIEDALGRKFPIPSEYPFELVIKNIEFRFEEWPMALWSDVRGGNYELSKTNNSNQIINAETPLLPGMAITMAVIFTVLVASDVASSCDEIHLPVGNDSPHQSKMGKKDDYSIEDLKNVRYCVAMARFSQSLGDQETRHEDHVSGEVPITLLNCHEIWDKLTPIPSFKDGRTDIDDLCDELRAKARCSESGVVVDQADVQAPLSRLSRDVDAASVSGTKSRPTSEPNWTLVDNPADSFFEAPFEDCTEELFPFDGVIAGHSKSQEQNYVSKRKLSLAEDVDRAHSKRCAR